MSKFKHACTPENAPKLWEWLRTRGGIAVWKSINLSNPGASWSTPATIRRGDCHEFVVRKNSAPGEPFQADMGSMDDIIPYPKPCWQCSPTPEVITDPADVGVFTSKLYKAFRVGLRGTGTMLKLTDGAQRKLDRIMAECKEKHGDSFYERGALQEIDGASMGVYFTTGVVPVVDYIKSVEGDTFDSTKPPKGDVIAS